MNHIYAYKTRVTAITTDGKESFVYFELLRAVNKIQRVLDSCQLFADSLKVPFRLLNIIVSVGVFYQICAPAILVSFLFLRGAHS